MSAASPRGSEMSSKRMLRLSRSRRFCGTMSVKLVWRLVGDIVPRELFADLRREAEDLLPDRLEEVVHGRAGTQMRVMLDGVVAGAGARGPVRFKDTVGEEGPAACDVPHREAGHTTAPDRICRADQRNRLRLRGRPHTRNAEPMKQEQSTSWRANRRPIRAPNNRPHEKRGRRAAPFCVVGAAMCEL